MPVVTVTQNLPVKRVVEHVHAQVGKSGKLLIILRKKPYITAVRLESDFGSRSVKVFQRILHVLQ